MGVVVVCFTLFVASLFVVFAEQDEVRAAAQQAFRGKPNARFAARSAYQGRNTEKLHHLKRCAVRRPAQSCSCSVSHARRTQISDPASMVERTKSCLRISILVELSNACVAASFAYRCISSPAGSRR